MVEGKDMWNPLRARRERREAELLERESFRVARRAAREDVTVLGEEIAALTPDAEGLGAREGAQAGEHHRFALDLYEQAKQQVEAAQAARDVDLATETLERGYWEIAAVKALVTGEPLPERRGPCYFNPQHGPAAATIDWSPPGGTSRRVEVCRGDELRLVEGLAPRIRTLRVNDRNVPWWEAQDAIAHTISPSVAANSQMGYHNELSKTEAGINRIEQGLGKGI